MMRMTRRDGNWNHSKAKGMNGQSVRSNPMIYSADTLYSHTIDTPSIHGLVESEGPGPGLRAVAPSTLVLLRSEPGTHDYDTFCGNMFTPSV